MYGWLIIGGLGIAVWQFVKWVRKEPAKDTTATVNRMDPDWVQVTVGDLTDTVMVSMMPGGAFLNLRVRMVAARLRRTARYREKGTHG